VKTLDDFLLELRDPEVGLGAKIFNKGLFVLDEAVLVHLLEGLLKHLVEKVLVTEAVFHFSLYFLQLSSLLVTVEAKVLKVKFSTI